MAADNLTRMIRLAEEFFSVKDDPQQLAVTPETREQLLRLHPRTLNEAANEHGPIAWVLVIPTTDTIMRNFLSDKISERELLEQTPVGARYETIYLCSAIVLPEHRGKGLAKRLTIEAIESIRKEHTITSLFVWPFSPDGEKLASSVARACSLPLFRKETDCQI